MPDNPARTDVGAALTSVHVRRAVDGDADSLRWVVVRLTPMLLAQANYRMGPHLRRLCEPQDIVNEAWLVALPRLADLAIDDRRATPILLGFLSGTILNLVRNLARKYVRTRGASQTTSSAVANAPAAVSGVVTSAVRGEQRDEVRTAIDALADADREILVLRGIEQQSLPTIAATLGLSVEAVGKRYQRALGRLRERLIGSVFDDLTET